ncbi:MAG: DUF5018 domain-containing protein [Prevotellaceae bacterium]|nr:DUF5018 domain-containing protein [Prevotellaceae bacterium]
MKKTKLVLVKYLLILVLIVPMASCSEDEPVETPKRTEKEITEFSIPSLELTGVVDPTAHSITLTVAPDFDQSSLESVVPDIKYKGVNIEPAVTEPQNFTRDVTYKVTAEDGSSQNYTVSLTVSEFFATGFAKVTEVWRKTDWEALNFAVHSENTMAYLNGKLVASRSGIILDAATGEPTGARLNVTGAEGKFNGIQTTLPNYPFSVTNDDAGNVIGTSLGAWTVDFHPVYKWTTSLESPPTLVYELNSSTWTGGGPLKQFGRKFTVTGDINGNGYIVQHNQDNGGAGVGDKKQYLWKVTGGAVNTASYTAVTGRDPSESGYYQMLIPMTLNDVYPYYLFAFGSITAIPPSEVSYKPNASQDRVIIEGFQNPEEVIIYGSLWGSYVYHAKKFDFNGVTYIAVLSVSAAQVGIEESTCIYYIAILDTRTNKVVKVIELPHGALQNTNATSSITNGLEETLPTGEKRIRLYTLFTNMGILCHELTNKP